MSRFLRTALITAMIAASVTGVALAAAAPVPEKQPNAVVQGAPVLPGDKKALNDELVKTSTVHYKILVADDIGTEDMTAYLDRVAEAWKEPAPDTLLLVVFPSANYDIRFFMGANFRRQGVTVDEMLGFLHTAYFPLSQKGDVFGGLAHLVRTVNERMTPAKS